MPAQRRFAPVSIIVRRRRLLVQAILAIGSLLLIPGLPLDPALAEDDASATGVVSSDILRSCSLPAAEPADHSRSERVLLGLAAFSCDLDERAIEWLAVDEDPEARFEDWRLFALAAASAETEELASGAHAADLLLSQHPTSPVRHTTFALRTRIALQSDEPERALAMARASRAAEFPDELRLELDILAWEAATRLGRALDIEREAKTLLIRSPVDALALEVVESLRDAEGQVPWLDHFRPWELLLRAERLVEADLLDEAFVALEAIPETERDSTWRLTLVRALIEDRRGVEALDALAEMEPSSSVESSDIAWFTSIAALEAATVRRGRSNLDSTHRAEMRRLAQEELRGLSEGDDRRAVAALQLLFEELADGEHFEEVIAVLEQLRRLEPGDTTGTSYLWRLGWKQHDERNYTGAIGYWAELMGLYPGTKSARSALYWTARSHEALGNTARAESLYEEVISTAATDYYRVHALRRLERPVDPRQPALPSSGLRPWPEDPRLERAQTLTDLGVDRVALRELELLEAEADPDASNALRSRILARQGQRRDSIQSLWRVFPMLGTAEQARVPPDALRMYYPTDYRDIIERFAAENGVPDSLLMAMIRQESAFDITARSWAGARGLMQVMPATAQELARRMGLPYSRERLNDPTYSVQLGSRYFRQVLDMFDGDLELALAGYNAGPYRIRKLVGRAGQDLEPDAFLEGLGIEESKTYVKRVVLFSNSYRQLYPDLG